MYCEQPICHFYFLNHCLFLICNVTLIYQSLTTSNAVHQSCVSGDYAEFVADLPLLRLCGKTP